MTVVAVLVAVLAAWSPWSSGTSAQATVSQSGTGNMAGDGNVGGDVTVGSGGCLVEKSGTCFITKPSDGDPQADAVKRVGDELAALPLAQAAPTGNGPWPFMVLGTGADKGEYVRDGVSQSNHRIRTASGPAIVFEFTTVWVDCRIDNGWAADTQTAAGGRWLKVRYPEVAERGDYWMYAGYLTPVNTNGLVPACPPT